MSLTYGFDKAKLPRGMAFPLKRSALDSALLEAGISGIHCVYYSLRQSGCIVMRAEYCGEGRRGWAAAGLASITVYAVPTTERPATEACLLSNVLPQLVDWLKALEAAGNTRRGVDQHFVATVEAETAVMTQS